MLVKTLTFLMLTAMIVGCSGTPNPSDTLKGGNGAESSSSTGGPGYTSLKGELGSSLKLKLKAGQRNSGSTNQQDVDQITAIPVPKTGNIDYSQVYQHIQNLDILSNGSFNIPLTNQNYDWVYLLINTSNHITNQVVGFITLKSSNDSLVSMPVNSITNDIQLGTVNITGNEAISSIDLSSNLASFNLSEASVLQMAKMDDVVKSVMNDYMNYHTNTGLFYHAGLSYHLDMSTSKLAGQTYSLPQDFIFRGYSVNFEHNNTLLSPPNMLNNQNLIEIFPPENVFIYYPKDAPGVGRTYGTTIPISSTNITTCQTNGDMYLCSSSADFAAGFFDSKQGGSFGTPGSMLTTNLVKGLWTVKLNQQPIAWADFELSYPYSADGTFLGLIPSLKLTLDGASKIQRIDIKWFLYNKNTLSYQEVEADVLKRLVKSDFTIGLTDYNGTNGTDRLEKYYYARNYINDPLDPLMSSITDNELQVWKLDAVTNTASEQTLEILSIQFYMGPIEFFYSFALD